MDETAMQTLGMGGELALAGGFASPSGQIPLAVFPVQALLPALFDPAPLIVVLRVIGAALTVHLALEPADGPGIGSQVSAQDLQTWSALARDERNGGGS